jgi:hypothetical protein
MAKAKRGRKTTTDREVPVSGRAYAASSTIAAGTADKVASERKGSICLCGCGAETRGGAFLPGHDSKARAQGKAVVEGRMKKSELKPETRNYLEEGGFFENAIRT